MIITQQWSLSLPDYNVHPALMVENNDFNMGFISDSNKQAVFRYIFQPNKKMNNSIG